jgi:hypothetical protein
LDDLEGHYVQWQKDVDEVMVSAGVTMENFSKKVSEETDEIKTKTEETKSSLMSIANAGVKGFNNLLTAVKKHADNYAD